VRRAYINQPDPSSHDRPSTTPLSGLDHPPHAAMSRAAAAPNPQGSRKISFNVSEQYDIQDVVGEGAYGVVW
jgi:hypothetical protein